MSYHKKKQQNNSIAIFCDFQNVLSIKKVAPFLIDFAKSKGRIVCNNLYYNSQHTSQLTAKNSLEVHGIKCIDVPCSLKNSADNQLIADCVKAVSFNSSLNTIILVLGDWDFAGLICILKSLGKKVIIFAQRGSASPKLMRLVGNDNFYFIDELTQLVSNQTHPQTTIIKYQIQDKTEICTNF